MTDKSCYFNSPAIVEGKTSSLYNPIFYSGRVYVLHDKKLIALLSHIGLIGDFLKKTRLEGPDSVKKWLKSKCLINEGFLENISKYWIETKDCKHIKDFRFFSKDKNFNPCINEDQISSTLYHSLLFSEIQKNNYEFNNFVCKELEFAMIDLNATDNITSFNNKVSFYRKTFLKSLITNFINKDYGNISRKLEKLKNINLTINTDMCLNNLAIKTIGALKDYKGLKFYSSGLRAAECISKGTTISIKPGNQNQGSVIDELLEITEEFTYSRYYFEKEYLLSLLNLNQPKHADVAHILTSMTYISSFHEKITNPLFERPALLTYAAEEPIILNAGQLLLDEYNSVKNANISFMNENRFMEDICAINLNNENTEAINNSLFKQQNAIQAKCINLCFDEEDKPIAPLGYATLKTYKF